MPISDEDEKVKNEQPSLLCAGAGKNGETSIDREETQCGRWVTSVSSFFLKYGNTLFASAPFIPFPVSSADVSSRFDEAQKERKIIIKMIDLRGEMSDLLTQKVLARLDKANDEELAKIQEEIQRVEEEITSLRRMLAETDKSHVS